MLPRYGVGTVAPVPTAETVPVLTCVATSTRATSQGPLSGRRSVPVGTGTERRPSPPDNRGRFHPSPIGWS